MESSEATKPAAETARGLREIVHLGRLNSFEANPSLSEIQAAHIARQFYLAPEIAAFIAPLVFGEARR